MGPKQRRERERTEIREKILDAARELFAAEGYEAVTMRGIAQRIEYSPTAIYFHFKDKESLFQELCFTDFLAFAHVFVNIARIADPIERLRQAGLAYVEFALGHPQHYRLMFMTPHPPVDPNQQNLIVRGNPEQDAYAFLRATCAQAVAEHRLRPELEDPELVAQAAWGAIHGVVSLHIAKCNDPWIDWRPVRAVAEATIETLVRGLRREA
jgi:AcrR family transcriptional regulator